MIFNNRTPYYEVKALPALVCGGAVFAVLTMAWRLWKKHGVQPEGRLEAVLVAVLLGGYWVLQLVFAFVLEVQPTRTWDFGLVFSAAQQYAQSGVLSGDYFSQFHNNAPMKLDIGNVHKGNPLQAYFVQGMPHTGRAVYAALGMQTALLAGLAAGPPGHGAACGGAGADAVFAFVGGAQPVSCEFSSPPDPLRRVRACEFARRVV